MSRTLLAPWRRLSETRSRTFSVEDWGGTLIVNLLMRLVGAGLRLTVMVVGAVVISVVVVAAALSFAVWVFLPVGLVVLVIVGIKALVA